jgi:hypothetical protein
VKQAARRDNNQAASQNKTGDDGGASTQRKKTISTSSNTLTQERLILPIFWVKLRKIFDTTKLKEKPLPSSVSDGPVVKSLSFCGFPI